MEDGPQRGTEKVHMLNCAVFMEDINTAAIFHSVLNYAGALARNYFRQRPVCACAILGLKLGKPLGSNESVGSKRASLILRPVV